MKEIPTVALTAEEDNDYGAWHRLGLANAHLGDYVAEIVDKISHPRGHGSTRPEEVAGHPLTAPNGPTSVELAGAIREIFRYE